MSEPPEPGSGHGVSPATATALREAMDRLLTGRAQHTDGRLLKANLHREAQVSRATMNRATWILQAWDAAVAERGQRSPAPPRRDPESDTLRARLSAKNRECAELHRRLDAAATAIAALYHDNTALRDELARHTRCAVIPLRARPGADASEENHT